MKLKKRPKCRLAEDYASSSTIPQDLSGFHPGTYVLYGKHTIPKYSRKVNAPPYLEVLVVVLVPAVTEEVMPASKSR